MPAVLDTDTIIKRVEKKKREMEERDARQNDNVLVGGGGGRGTNRGGQPPQARGSPAPAMDKDAYKRLWEQQNTQVDAVDLCLALVVDMNLIFH